MSTKPTDADVNKPQTTLSEEQIVTERQIGRRSVLTAIGATVFGATATALTTACGSDPGPQPVAGPPPQQSSGGTVVVAQGAPAQTGLTDSDSGPYADPAGNGRGLYGRAGWNSGLTDSDGGPYADPAGQGRGPRRGWQTGITDSDGGPHADPAGYGRGLYGRSGWTSGVTDSDGGPYADPAGNGRGHR